MSTILNAMLMSMGGVMLLASFLHLVPRLGAGAARAVSRAPLLDLIVALFTLAPGVIAGFTAGWRGLIGAIAGQVLALLLWAFLHETANPSATRGPRIITFINRSVGRWRNHTALWVTVISVPVFWVIRAAQIVTYPFFVWLLKFPRYRHGDWVNVSRQKFQGLVGHDLIWCLYCDWMTGVYALGGEMLRNVESFWCPIRFSDKAKCENCRIDFPDIDGGWVEANKDMAEVVRTLGRYYGDGRREWFGHPARLTIKGREPGGASAETTGSEPEARD